mmetsp:Transcript_48551/g.135683  ORF Transcript_48551/g.135683 Transcript_48551/m.135683 type:complete len:412 (-) Transcript_48551:107-1342(-)
MHRPGNPPAVFVLAVRHVVVAHEVDDQHDSGEHLPGQHREEDLAPLHTRRGGHLLEVVTFVVGVRIRGHVGLTSVQQLIHLDGQEGVCEDLVQTEEETEGDRVDDDLVDAGGLHQKCNARSRCEVPEDEFGEENEEGIRNLPWHRHPRDSYLHLVEQLVVFRQITVVLGQRDPTFVHVGHGDKHPAHGDDHVELHEHACDENTDAQKPAHVALDAVLARIGVAVDFITPVRKQPFQGGGNETPRRILIPVVQPRWRHSRAAGADLCPAVDVPTEIAKVHLAREVVHDQLLLRYEHEQKRVNDNANCQVDEAGHRLNNQLFVPTRRARDLGEQDGRPVHRVCFDADFAAVEPPQAADEFRRHQAVVVLLIREAQLLGGHGALVLEWAFVGRPDRGVGLCNVGLCSVGVSILC